MQIWDVKKLSKVRDIPNAVSPMLFAQQDTLLITRRTQAATIDIWSVSTDALVQSGPIKDDRLSSIQRLTNEKEVLYTDPFGAYILDLGTGHSKTLFEVDNHTINSILSWDGQRAIYIDYWDCVHEWRIGYSVPIKIACTFGSKWSFDPKDNLWAVNSEGNGVQTNTPANVVWIQSANLYRVIDMLPHEGFVRWLRWSPDNTKLATATEYDVLRVWEESRN